MIALLDIEKEYGVPISVIRNSIVGLKIKQEMIKGKAYISSQDAETIVFNYYAKNNSYAWTVVAKKFKTSRYNIQFRMMIDSIIPHFCIGTAVFYPADEVDDLLENMGKYHLKKYKDRYYYMEGSNEDYLISKYFSLYELKEVFEQKYGIKFLVENLNRINQSRHTYPIKKIKIFGLPEYVIPRKYFSLLMDDYYHFYIVEKEENPYRRYEKETECSAFDKKRFEKTLNLFDNFSKLKLSVTKKQMHEVKVLADIHKYLLENLDKEIFLYTNKEITQLAQNTKIESRRNKQLYQFFKYVVENCDCECAFDMGISPKKEVKEKTSQDFYSEKEWAAYVNFIFDIDRHIEKAFENYEYARYWLFAMLQCSLAWRTNDITNIPALQIMDIDKYTLEWFENNSFTLAEAWKIINNAKCFIEQDRVNKTGAKKHFIILNSFAIPTAIGIVICEQYRKSTGGIGLFGKFRLRYEKMIYQLGSEMKGFTNLKATRSILSFANETASNMEYSGQAINIASYMRSHIVNSRGFANMTETYLKTSFDEKELLSIPAKMGEIGLFGWLYNEILIAVDGEKHNNKEELIEIIKEDVTPQKLEGYSNFLLNEQRKREQIFSEIMQCGSDSLKELCTKLQHGMNNSKKDNIYCIKNRCKYPTSENCELCEYAIPSIHALYVVGQEVSDLLDKLIAGVGTDFDKERYYYQLFKLLTILKEAKVEFGEEFVASFVDYDGIGQKLLNLKKLEKGEV